MYAVVKIGGRQYRVSEGDILFVDRQHSENDDSLTFEDILMLNDEDGGINIGTPVIEGASVEATLLDQVKADKVIVFKKKRRKGYKKKRGHRQPLSQIRIESIASSTRESKEEESAAEETRKEDAPKKAISTEMTAKEAVEHIQKTSLKELEDFVAKDEERVTVQKAWEEKQEEEH
jgi:large subunit ribosomal protein L21